MQVRAWQKSGEDPKSAPELRCDLHNWLEGSAPGESPGTLAGIAESAILWVHPSYFFPVKDSLTTTLEI